MLLTPRRFDSVIVATGQAGKPLAAALAVHGGEIMSVLQTAMMGDLPYTAIRDAVYAHPTPAEPVQNRFARLDG